MSSGSISLGSNGIVKGVLYWTATNTSGREWYIKLSVGVTRTDWSGSHSEWAHIYVNGDLVVDESYWGAGGTENVFAEYSFYGTANSHGRVETKVGGLAGVRSESTGDFETENSVDYLQVTDPNYTVYYYTNDGSGNLYTSQSGHGSGATHTVIYDTPIHYGITSRTENFTITGNANGGDKDLSIIATKKYQITHTFLGWSTLPTNTAATYTAGDQFTVNDDVYLYGIWNTSENVSGYENNTLKSLGSPTRTPNDNTYDVILVPNNGNSFSTVSAGLYISYLFKGWSETPSGSILSNTTAYTSDTTVYAIWTKNIVDNRVITLYTPTKASSVIDSYTINLDANGGAISQDSMTSNRAITYKFKGWSTIDNDSSAIVSNPYTPNGSEITLYGIWESNESTDTLELPIPTIADFKFLGWAVNENSTEYVDMSYTPTQNITLYALYKPSYTGEMYIWHDGKWHRIVPYLHHDDVFNETISAI